MSYQKFVYNRVNWVNKSEALTTPLGKNNLNNMDSGIKKIADNLDIVYNELDTKKFNQSDAGKVLSAMPTWDDATGILHFSFYDGTEFDVDFNIEKIPVKFSMSTDGTITMITADGTEWTCNIFDAIPDFADSEHIHYSKETDESGSSVVKFDLIKGSITDEYLTPQYLAQITEQANKAESSMLLAKQYEEDSDFNAKLSQSYAIGGSSVREGEDIDNSKYYSEMSKGYRDDTQKMIDNHGDILDEIDKKLNLARFSVDDDGDLIYTDNSYYDFMVDENGNLNWEVKTNG